MSLFWYVLAAIAVVTVVAAGVVAIFYVLAKLFQWILGGIATKKQKEEFFSTLDITTVYLDGSDGVGSYIVLRNSSKLPVSVQIESLTGYYEEALYIFVVQPGVPTNILVQPNIDTIIPIQIDMLDPLPVPIDTFNVVLRSVYNTRISGTFEFLIISDKSEVEGQIQDLYDEFVTALENGDEEKLVQEFGMTEDQIEDLSEEDDFYDQSLTGLEKLLKSSVKSKDVNGEWLASSLIEMYAPTTNEDVEVQDVVSEEETAETASPSSRTSSAPSGSGRESGSETESGSGEVLDKFSSLEDSTPSNDYRVLGSNEIVFDDEMYKEDKDVISSLNISAKDVASLMLAIAIEKAHQDIENLMGDQLEDEDFLEILVKNATLGPRHWEPGTRMHEDKDSFISVELAKNLKVPVVVLGSIPKYSSEELVSVFPDEYIPEGYYFSLSDISGIFHEDSPYNLYGKDDDFRRRIYKGTVLRSIDEYLGKEESSLVGDQSVDSVEDNLRDYISESR